METDKQNNDDVIDCKKMIDRKIKRAILNRFEK